MSAGNYPWRFITDDGGVRFGAGTPVPLTDHRVELVRSVFPLEGRRVAEPGCFEGCTTLALLRAGVVVVPSDARSINCEMTHLRLKAHGFDVPVQNFPVERIHEQCEYKFDAVLCFGLLYHLASPLEALISIAKVTDTLFLDTHFAVSGPQYAQECLNHPELSPWEYRGLHFFGKYYHEAPTDNGGGLSAASQWLSESSLRNALSYAGFFSVKELSRNDTHQRVLLMCTKTF